MSGRIKLSLSGLEEEDDLSPLAEEGRKFSVDNKTLSGTPVPLAASTVCKTRHQHRHGAPAAGSFLEEPSSGMVGSSDGAEMDSLFKLALSGLESSSSLVSGNGPSPVDRESLSRQTNEVWPGTQRRGEESVRNSSLGILQLDNIQDLSSSVLPVGSNWQAGMPNGGAESLNNSENRSTLTSNRYSIPSSGHTEGVNRTGAGHQMAAASDGVVNELGAVGFTLGALQHADDPDVSLVDVKLDEHELRDFDEEFSDLGDLDNTMTEEDHSKTDGQGHGDSSLLPDSHTALSRKLLPRRDTVTGASFDEDPPPQGDGQFDQGSGGGYLGAHGQSAASGASLSYDGPLGRQNLEDPGVGGHSPGEGQEDRPDQSRYLSSSFGRFSQLSAGIGVRRADMLDSVYLQKSPHVHEGGDGEEEGANSRLDHRTSPLFDDSADATNGAGAGFKLQLSDSDIDTEDELEAVRQENAARQRTEGSTVADRNGRAAQGLVRPGLEGGSSEEMEDFTVRQSGEGDLRAGGVVSHGGDGSSAPNSDDDLQTVPSSQTGGTRGRDDRMGTRGMIHSHANPVLDEDDPEAQERVQPMGDDVSALASQFLLPSGGMSQTLATDMTRNWALEHSTFNMADVYSNKHLNDSGNRNMSLPADQTTTNSNRLASNVQEQQDSVTDITFSHKVSFGGREFSQLQTTHSPCSDGTWDGLASRTSDASISNWDFGTNAGGDPWGSMRGVGDTEVGMVQNPFDEGFPVDQTLATDMNFLQQGEDFMSADQGLAVLNADEQDFMHSHVFIQDDAMMSVDGEPSWSFHNTSNVTRPSWMEDASGEEDLANRISIGTFIRSRTEALGALDGQKASKRPNFGSETVTSPESHGPVSLLPDHLSDITEVASQLREEIRGSGVGSDTDGRDDTLTAEDFNRSAQTVHDGKYEADQSMKLSHLNDASVTSSDRHPIDDQLPPSASVPPLGATQTLTTHPYHSYQSHDHSSVNDSVTSEQASDRSVNLGSNTCLNLSAITQFLTSSSASSEPLELADMIMKMSRAKAGNQPKNRQTLRLQRQTHTVEPQTSENQVEEPTDSAASGSGQTESGSRHKPRPDTTVGVSSGHQRAAGLSHSDVKNGTPGGVSASVSAPESPKIKQVDKGTEEMNKLHRQPPAGGLNKPTKSVPNSMQGRSLDRSSSGNPSKSNVPKKSRSPDSRPLGQLGRQENVAADGRSPQRASSNENIAGGKKYISRIPSRENLSKTGRIGSSGSVGSDTDMKRTEKQSEQNKQQRPQIGPSRIPTYQGRSAAEAGVRGRQGTKDKQEVEHRQQRLPSTESTDVQGEVEQELADRSRLSHTADRGQLSPSQANAGSPAWRSPRPSSSMYRSRTKDDHVDMSNLIDGGHEKNGSLTSGKGIMEEEDGHRMAHAVRAPAHKDSVEQGDLVERHVDGVASREPVGPVGGRASAAVTGTNEDGLEETEAEPRSRTARPTDDAPQGTGTSRSTAAAIQRPPVPHMPQRSQPNGHQKSDWAQVSPSSTSGPAGQPVGNKWRPPVPSFQHNLLSTSWPQSGTPTLLTNQSLASTPFAKQYLSDTSVLSTSTWSPAAPNSRHVGDTARSPGTRTLLPPGTGSSIHNSGPGQTFHQADLGRKMYVQDRISLHANTPSMGAQQQSINNLTSHSISSLTSNTTSTPSVWHNGSLTAPSILLDHRQLLGQPPHYADTSARSVRVPSQLQLPEVCCVGLSTHSTLPIVNTSSHWLQVALRLTSLHVDKEARDHLTEVPFVMKDKVVVEPNGREEVKVMFVPRQAGEYCGEVETWVSPVMPGDASHRYQPAAHVMLQATAEQPNIQVVTDKEGHLDFGALPHDCHKGLPVQLVNRGRATIPVRLMIVGGTDAMNCFTFDKYPYSTGSGVIRGGGRHMPSFFTSIANLLLTGCQPTPGGAVPTQVLLHCHMPAQQRHRGLSTDSSPDPLRQLTARLQVELDTPATDTLLASVPIHGVLGTARLHTDTETIHLESSLGHCNHKTIMMRNAGNITFEVSLEVTDWPDVFQVPPRFTIQPQQLMELEVKFKPEHDKVDHYTSLLLMVIEPEGPAYEISLSGQVCQTAVVPPGGLGGEDQPALLTNKHFLAWGGVAIGRAVQQSVMLANNSCRATKLGLYIKAQTKDFQLVSQCGHRELLVSSREVIVKANDKLPISILFAPSSVAGVKGHLQIKASHTGTKYRIPLSGYGGVSCVVLEGVKTGQNSTYWSTVGQLSGHHSRSTQVLLRNTGTRAAFVKGDAFKDLACRERLNSYQLKMSPDQFCLLPHSTQMIQIELFPSAQQKMQCQHQPYIVASVTWYYGDEVSRCNFRRYLAKNTDVSPVVGQHNPLHGIDFNVPYQNEDLVTDDDIQATDNDMELFYSTMSRVMLALVGQPPRLPVTNDGLDNHTTAAGTDHVGLKPLTAPPISKWHSSDAVTSSQGPRVDTSSSHSRTKSSEPQQAKVLSVRQGDSKNMLSDALTGDPALVQNGVTGNTWTLKPDHLILLVSLANTVQQIKQVQLVNYTQRPLGFELSWPAHCVHVTPEQGQIGARSSVSVYISASPRIHKSSLPWSGRVYVTCDGQQKVIHVQAREDSLEVNTDKEAVTLPPQSHAVISEPVTPLITVSSPSQPSGDQVKVTKQQVEFQSTQLASTSECPVELTNISGQPIKWLVSSFAPAYVKSGRDTQAVHRVNYMAFQFAKLSGLLQPQQQVQVMVRFCPLQPGTYSQYWDICTQSTQLSSKRMHTCKLELIGQGTVGVPEMEREGAIGQTKSGSEGFQTRERTTGSMTSLGRTREKTVTVASQFVEFPACTAGQCQVCKVEVKNNNMKKVQTLNIPAPEAPFYVKHSRVTVRNKHFVRIPVEFRPTQPGFYQAVLIIRLESGATLSVCLKAECVQ